jgi:seryl-tRNA synthetase
MKYEQRLEELGVDKTMVSKGLQKKIKDFEDLLDFVDGSKKELNDIEDEDEKQDLEDEINRIEEDIPMIDDKLVSDINFWDRNKEMQAINVQKMADAREAKKLAANGGVMPPQAATQEPKVSTAQYNNAPLPTEEKKKKDWVWWGIAGFVAVVTLGAVWMSKDE